MPLSSGLSIHDDTKHKGSAKRDAVNGVAALDALGNLLSKWRSLKLVEDSAGYFDITERVSGEECIVFQRVSTTNFNMWIKRASHTYMMQDAGMKDVADGIAGLDANARIIGSLLGVASQEAQHTTKSASATLRNSHDAEVQMGESVWTLQKTITVDNGISGILRIKHDNYNHVATDHTLSQVRKNGIVLGVVQDNNAATTYTTYSEDLDVGVMQAAETLELWGYGLPVGAANHKVKNFRLYYDDNLPIAVDTTNSTP